MLLGVLQFVILVKGFHTTIGKSVEEADRCISRGPSNDQHIKSHYCRSSGTDVKISCLPNQVVVISSLQFAVKVSSEVCMKRILPIGVDFCCKEQSHDILYDGDCMQSVWNKEDTTHYQQFIRKALDKCHDTPKCVLDSEMFANLQKEIPRSKKYSSYFQILYQCINVPVKSVRLCSSISLKEMDIHLKRNAQPSVPISEESKTCTCSVTSQVGSYVTIKAVDVRITRSDLLLSSETKSKNISRGHQPLFGFRAIMTGTKVTLTVNSGVMNTDDNIWLYASGSGGKEVNVICGEPVPHVESTASPPVGCVRNVHKKTVFWGYWPLIYIAAGSVFTLLIVGCILGSVLICKRIRGKEEDHPQHPDEHLQECHHYGYGHHYATVLDDTPQSPIVYGTRGSNPTFAVNDQNYARSFQRAAVVNKATVSSHPSSLGSCRGLEELSVPGPGRITTPGTSCDVSELEAFLECK